MKVRLTPRALAEAKRIKTWWRRHRPAAADLFEEELEAALERIRTMPSTGSLYEQQGSLEVPVRRVMLPKTQNHVYYVVAAGEVVVLSVWGAPKGRGPKI